MSYYAELLCVLQTEATLMVFGSIYRSDYDAYLMCRKSNGINLPLASTDII